MCCVLNNNNIFIADSWFISERHNQAPQGHRSYSETVLRGMHRMFRFFQALLKLVRFGQVPLSIPNSQTFRTLR